MPKKKLLIFPFNGNGIEALDCVNDEFDFLGFIDDDREKRSDDYKIYTREILNEYSDTYLLAVPGSPTSFLKRESLIGGLGIEEKRFVTIVHYTASIGKNVKLGFNCLIMPGVVITSNAVIGDHVCVLPNSVIHHDAVVNDHTLIGSNVVIAGGTIIGRNCYIGSGTTIINGITVGEHSLIGMGSNIIKTVAAHSKMVGNPARDLNSGSR
jgi:sugar O-acyltransferase (sialic acid O-acetyltransferase NeuD family)